MESLLAWILMAAISLPVSYFVALGCLRGLVRMMRGSVRRNVV